MATVLGEKSRTFQRLSFKYISQFYSRNILPDHVRCFWDFPGHGKVGIFKDPASHLDLKPLVGSNDSLTWGSMTPPGKGQMMVNKTCKSDVVTC